jgi:hypothetical protein
MTTIERSADLAVVGANGGAWAVDLGVTTPTMPTTMDAPSTPWFAIGAISDDGLTYGFDEDSQEFTPWGLSTPFRTEVTKSIRTFGLTAWETNRRIVKSLQYRLPVASFDPDVVGGLYSFAENASPQPDRRGFIFDVYDGTRMERFFVPSGEVTDRSDVKFASKEMSGYQWTITAYPDAAGNSVYHLGVGTSNTDGTGGAS